MFTFRIQVSGALLRRPDVQALVNAELDSEIVQILSIGQRLVVAETPRGATGQLRGSVVTELRGQPGRRVGLVTTPLFYGDIVERGRQPGRRPPTAALVLWVTRKLGISDARQARAVAYLIARKIGRVGTSGAAMFFKATQRLAPIVEARMRALGERIAERYGGR